MANNAPERPSVQSVLQATEDFFAPAIVDRKNNKYVAQKLTDPKRLSDEVRVHLLRKTGELLQVLHSAVVFEQTSHSRIESYDSSLLLALYKILDFLVLEGIYPSLPPGLGSSAEARNKSLFYAKPDPSYSPLRGSNQLDLVLVSIFEPILCDAELGIEPLIRHRVLPDLVAASALWSHERGEANFSPPFASYLDKLPTSTLLGCYTNLLRTTKVDWFRAIISEYLSLLPLRTNGVRSTIDFLAASNRPAQAQQNNEEHTATSGPIIPLEALQQASKLLSSVPRSVSQQQYFSMIAPQLLDLLDDQEEPALQKAAAFIVGNGILGKKSIGSPGSIGWTLFAIPVLESISPSNITTGLKRKAELLSTDSTDKPVVTQAELDQGLRRLALLVLSHPNPGLTGRLVRPALLPLWALSSYHSLSFTATELTKCAFTILGHFLRLVGTPANLIFLSENILCTGTNHWTFATEDSGGISIRRSSNQRITVQTEAHLVEELTRADKCVGVLIRLVNASQIGDEAISILFFHLFNQQASSSHEGFPQSATSQALLKPLLSAKLLQALMEAFADHLVKKSEQILALIDQILGQHLHDGRTRKRTSAIEPSLFNLGNITSQNTTTRAQEETYDRQDSLLLVLSLLNAFVVSAGFVPESQSTLKLASIRQHLRMIEANAHLNESLSLQVRTTLALLDSRSSSMDLKSTSDVDTENVLDVQRTLILITSDLASDLPPIRRSALHALQTLIKSPDALLDVPPLALLLLDVIRLDKEEFVYLAAVQTIVQLALRRNLGYLMRLLIDSFQDTNEDTGVDGRLRIGEALASIADELGSGRAQKLQIHETVEGSVQSLLEVASRRGYRQREELARQREERLQQRKRKEAERAWGGEVPDVPMEESDTEEDEFLSLSDKQRRLHDLEQIESIVKGWENTSYEEDVRIRASALSIVGRLFENCPPVVQGSAMAAQTIEICLPILSMELEPAKAIVRRAAALAIFGILKGIDAQLEAGTIDSQAPLNGDFWLKVEKVLRWVVDTDPDELTVGHSETVLEGLEAVRMKVLANVVQSTARPDELDGQLKGLTVEPTLESDETDEAPASGTTKRPIIEELE